MLSKSYEISITRLARQFTGFFLYFSGSDAGQEGPNIDHFDFGLITPALVHLEELHLTYG